jgi:hypothetical protein
MVPEPEGSSPNLQNILRQVALPNCNSQCVVTLHSTTNDLTNVPLFEDILLYTMSGPYIKR